MDQPPFMRTAIVHKPPGEIKTGIPGDLKIRGDVDPMKAKHGAGGTLTHHVPFGTGQAVGGEKLIGVQRQQQARAGNLAGRS